MFIPPISDGASGAFMPGMSEAMAAVVANAAARMMLSDFMAIPQDALAKNASSVAPRQDGQA
jgi:hypothetical protein